VTRGVGLWNKETCGPVSRNKVGAVVVRVIEARFERTFRKGK
jgi:hypothetical protein